MLTSKWNANESKKLTIRGFLLPRIESFPGLFIDFESGFFIAFAIYVEAAYFNVLKIGSLRCVDVCAGEETV